ncbi:MAG TPA: gas vesicle protein [Gemmatimonadaceae bacterium]|jgi:hypothetical protein|nr:gas vesicle protein [Gemmatimonadaceae bacterium]
MPGDDIEPISDEERLVLGELLNHVLDKGVVITGDVTISVAGIDLIRAGLSLYLTSVETLERAPSSSGDLPVLPD